MNQPSVPVASERTDTRRKLGIVGTIRKHFWGYLFLLPALVIFLLFLWTPIVKGFIYSFYHIEVVKGKSSEFVGWDNYSWVLHNPDVLISIKNTLYYVFLGIVIGFWVPIVFAIMISEVRRFQGILRVAAYLPNVLPVVVLYGLWRWFYDPVGPINATLTQMGHDQILFMTNPHWSMASIVIMETWQQFGSGMLIYLAAVLSVPKDLYEAAEIDGAGIFQRIWNITLPSIRGLIGLMFILQLIATSQGLQAQFAMLDGGPNKATLTYALLIVKSAFSQFQYGPAAAMGVLMFVVLAGFAIIQNRLSRKAG